MDHPTSAVVNEVDRVVIRLPDDATIYRSPTYIAVAIDASESGVLAPSLLNHCDRLDYLAPYELFNSLCRDRAQRTVDGRLLMEGRPIAPEQYLALWRSAIVKALSPSAANASHGMRIFARLSAPLGAAKGWRSPWTSCPFGTFDAVLKKHRASVQVDDTSGVFVLCLDLRSLNAARDAFLAASMFPHAGAPASNDCSAKLILESTPITKAQPALFESHCAAEA